jgi:hypothetical protein
MMLPVRKHADQQIRTPDERGSHGFRAAESQVIAAAGPAMPSIQGEGLGAEPLFAGDSVQRLD